MFTDSRVLPASGEFPTPWKDITGTNWQKYMRAGEIAMFCFDARTGQPMTITGDVPETVVRETCTAYRSLYMARLVARGTVIAYPKMITVLYDKRGRWLSTFSLAGEDRRNAGIGVALLLLQFPVLALLGTLLILALSAASGRAIGTDRIRWEDFSAREWNGLVTAGLLLGMFGKVIFDQARRRAVICLTADGRQPVGSSRRDRFYRRLARTNNSSLLIPLDITYEPTTITWPSQEKYDRWSETLRREGFESVGSYQISEVRSDLELWFHAGDDLVAEVANHPKAGMWVGVFTRYEDWSSFGVSNKKNFGLVDPHPTKKIVHIGADATAKQVIEKARRERPQGARRKAVHENILSDYATSWRQYVEWRRARGTTADEYKRVAERKAEANARDESWL